MSLTGVPQPIYQIRKSDKGLVKIGDTSADGLATSDLAEYDLSYGHLFNGVTWDRERNDIEVTLKTSALQNAGAASGSDTTAHNAESLLLVVDVTVVAAGGTLTMSLQGKDGASGSYYNFWVAELPIKATGTYAYFFANGASGAEYTETLAVGLGPRVWRYQATVATAAVTFSVSCVMGDN